jgi:Ca-activated chloride channel family protein
MFELASPWALSLIFLPLLVWFLLPKAKVKLPAALPVPFFAAMQGLVERQKKFNLLQTALWLPLLIWVFLMLALSGPRWIGTPRPIEREGYNIMMVMDLSGSMAVTDMVQHGRPISRLQVVKRAAEQFVRERSGDKLGLILFGTRAYLQTPLTYDRHSLLARIEDATPGLAGQTTSIGDALGLAVKHLQSVPSAGRVIILLTDGASNTGVLNPLKAAELAKDEDIKVYTIGLGSSAQLGNMATSLFMPGSAAELDEDSLQKIADITGGQYFRATNPTSLQRIYQKISALEKIKQEQETIRPQKEYYPWPLCAALFMLFGWLWTVLGHSTKANRLGVIGSTSGGLA